MNLLTIFSIYYAVGLILSIRYISKIYYPIYVKTVFGMLFLALLMPLFCVGDGLLFIAEKIDLSKVWKILDVVVWRKK